LYQRAFDDIAAALVGRESLAYWIRYVAADPGELSQETHLLGVLRKKEVDQSVMITCHGEDMGAAFQKLLGHGLAPEAMEIDPKF